MAIIKENLLVKALDEKNEPSPIPMLMSNE